ncbi:MAG: cytochrome c biogenesis protein CcsA [Myxococcales bacterium]|nr:MAG: cytochrome c biogenesis protein CcsA [Myxococcales bacterium]
MLATLYAIFIIAPTEARMGIVQKIFYIHVPSAYAMYLGFLLCGIGSALYLIKKDERWDRIALASGEVGLLFCVVVLITGPLWARKAWGVYWTWDPRLTTTLLAGLVFASYWVLRNLSAAGGEAEKKFAAALAVLGIVDLPVIHYSVQRWRGTHPAVISGKGGGLHPDMVPALLLAFLTFTLLVSLLITLRAHLEKLDQQAEALEYALQERALKQ